MNHFNYKKAVQAVNYLVKLEGSPINKMKSLKLIWLSDRLHLRMYARTIIGDKYYALKHGPVASRTRDILESRDVLKDVEAAYGMKYLQPSGQYSIASVSPVDLTVFSQTDIKVLDNIYHEYGKYDEKFLSGISHYFPEWKKFEDLVKDGGSERMHLIDFFENPLQENQVFNISPELLALSKEFYTEA